MWFYCKSLASTREVCAGINGWEHFCCVEFFAPWEFLNSDGKYVGSVLLILIIQHVCGGRR